MAIGRWEEGANGEEREGVKMGKVEVVIASGNARIEERNQDSHFGH